MRRSVIVGDIHGCFEELLELLDTVELAPDDLLISVGDLVDRGPEPGAVVRFFRERPNSVVVMGNHERKHVRGILSYAQEITRLQIGDDYADMVEWMRTLPYYFENEAIRVVHAAMVPGIALADQRPEVLCGSTRGERELGARFADGHWHDRYDDSVPIVFGHHVTGDEPLIRDGRIFGLDTGACHGGALSALCVPEFTVHSVRAHADHWSNTRRRWQLPVLRSKPWHDFTWSQSAETVARFASTPDPATREWLAAVDAWAARLRESFPAVINAAYDRARELGADRIGEHRAARFLFQAHHGRLDHASLTRQCTTPRRVIELATALGVDLPELPR
ncbi:metallophosphoesterase family protein [Nocardia noduli]|uniref:metallophosphoesterase family protein n=1 Tax=Nocardia noduli TaxID=2815722 RepID=UPI001C22D08E|nr:metallophosphoesterase family protein [Nocardia noduli]